MAHKKGQGSTKNGRDSESKRLGVKNLVANLSEQVVLLYVSVERNFIPV